MCKLWNFSFIFIPKKTIQQKYEEFCFNFYWTSTDGVLPTDRSVHMTTIIILPARYGQSSATSDKTRPSDNFCKYQQILLLQKRLRTLMQRFLVANSNSSISGGSSLSHLLSHSVTSHFNIRMLQHDSEIFLLAHAHSQLEVFRPCSFCFELIFISIHHLIIIHLIIAFFCPRVVVRGIQF